MIKELAEVKIGELSNELDALYVGIAMGYHRNEKQFTPNSEPIAKDSNSNDVIYKEGDKLYFFDAKRNKYYEAQLECLEPSHNEQDHTFSCYGFVWYKCSHESEDQHSDACLAKGLNGKMSNLKISELGGEYGMTKIAKSLTIGDLIDSGMMSLTEENEYKLDIIFDNCNVDNCSLSDYLAEKAKKQLTGETLSAKDYYKSKHGNDNQFRFKWKELLLSDFVSTLIGAL